MNRRGAIKYALLAALPCSLFGAGATSRPANPAPSDTSIQVAAPKEVEFRDESRDDNGKPRQIILDLTGQAMNRAVAYANFRIEQAIDDIAGASGESPLDCFGSPLWLANALRLQFPFRFPLDSPPLAHSFDGGFSLGG